MIYLSLQHFLELVGKCDKLCEWQADSSLASIFLSLNPAYLLALKCGNALHEELPESEEKRCELHAGIDAHQLRIITIFSIISNSNIECDCMQILGYESLQHCEKGERLGDVMCGVR